jgi:hypothetical protein
MPNDLPRPKKAISNRDADLTRIVLGAILDPNQLADFPELFPPGMPGCPSSHGELPELPNIVQDQDIIDYSKPPVLGLRLKRQT